MHRLTVKNLCAFYGKRQVIFDVTLSVKAGDAVAVLGRNGAGKTSLLGALAGTVKSRSDSIQVGDTELRTLPVYRRVRAGVALVPSGARVFPNLTTDENLRVVMDGGRSHTGEGSWTIDAIYSNFPALYRLRDSRGSSLSGGERQILAVARALRANPVVLMLDEPSEGLAPLVVQEVSRVVGRLREAGVALLFTEQNYRLALEWADDVHFIEKGALGWSGTAADAGRPEPLQRFLGV